jgi:hypothetical protein
MNGGPRPGDDSRLIHGDTGILSIIHDGRPGAICDDGFNDNSAATACFELYGSSSTVISYTHGHACDHQNFWLDDVVCPSRRDRLV